MSELLPPPDLRARVLDAVRREPMTPRGSGRTRSIVALAFGAATPVAFLLYLGAPFVGRRPVAYVAVVVAGWAAMAAWASWAAVGRGRSMLGRRVATRVAVSALVPIVLLAIALVASQFWPQTIDHKGRLSHHVTCAAFEAGFALGPMIAFAVARWRSDPVAPRLAGAAIASAAGAWGATAIELYCVRATPWHVLWGHVVPVALLALVGAWMGRALLGVASRAKNE
jgi:hypothetical protein